MSPSLCVQRILQIYEAGTDAPYQCVTKINYLFFWTKTYVVGAQKNRLNETFFLAPKTNVKTNG